MNLSLSSYCLTINNATTAVAVLRSTSTGKEKDEETGYHYFGARYMDRELMTMWLSVDPMSDKYSGISPYAYCAWTRPTGGDEHRLIKSNIVNNPIRLVSPNVKELILFLELMARFVVVRRMVTRVKLLYMKGMLILMV